TVASGVLAGLLALVLIGTTRAGPGSKDREPVYDGRTVPQWIKALQDERTATRRAAAFALSRIGLPAHPAVKPLAGARADGAELVRVYSARALGRIGTLAAPVAAELARQLGGESRLATESAQALGRLGRSAVPPLVKALSHEKPRARRLAATALA